MKSYLPIFLILLMLVWRSVSVVRADTIDSIRYPIPTISPICQVDLDDTEPATSQSVRRPGLRSSVAAVIPAFDSTSHAVFADYALYLSRASFSRVSRYLSSLHHGISGSGVVIRYTLPTGGDTLLLVTNHHVVSCADSVTLSFVEGMSETVYHRCRVLAVSPLTDLALVELPRGADVVPLLLDTTSVWDGQDILSVGYPGLAGTPSWQLTKGSVSNANLRNSHLLGKCNSAYQHSAPVDPGSSGGPLLVQDEYEGYRIIGINTWKAYYREGVGIAIPSREVLRFVRDCMADSVVPIDTMACTAAWNELLRMDYIAASEALSPEVFRAYTGSEWYNLYYRGGNQLHTEAHALDTEDPLDVVRMVLAFQLMRYLCEAPRDAQIDLKWAYRQGRLCIVEVTPPALSARHLRRATRYLRTNYSTSLIHEVFYNTPVYHPHM